MPSTLPNRSSAKFGEDFVRTGGLRQILNVLDKDALPFDVDYDIRQSAYLIALQLAGYLLCGQTVLHDETSSMAISNPVASPNIRPTPPKKTALGMTFFMTQIICKSQLFQVKITFLFVYNVHYMFFPSSLDAESLIK